MKAETARRDGVHRYLFRTVTFRICSQGKRFSTIETRRLVEIFLRWLQLCGYPMDLSRLDPVATEDNPYRPTRDQNEASKFNKLLENWQAKNLLGTMPEFPPFEKLLRYPAGYRFHDVPWSYKGPFNINGIPTVACNNPYRTPYWPTNDTSLDVQGTVALFQIHIHSAKFVHHDSIYFKVSNPDLKVVHRKSHNVITMGSSAEPVNLESSKIFFDRYRRGDLYPLTVEDRNPTDYYAPTPVRECGSAGLIV